MGWTRTKPIRCSHSQYSRSGQTFDEASPVWAGHAQNLFASRLTLVQCRVHAQASVVPPTYLAIAAFNLRIVPLHSSPVLVFFWNRYVRLPEVSVNNALTKIICNTASCTSRIFAARALDFAVKFRFVFRYENLVFRRYV